MAKTVRLVDGVPAVTDGPYIEAKEYIGSFDIVDCETRSGRSRSPHGSRSPASGRWRCGRSCTRPRPTCEPGTRVEDVLRALAPQVLGALVRRYGHFDACEDAVQEALLAAAVQWPEQGQPENPRAWLITVASRRLTDELRSNESRRRREDSTSAMTPPQALVAPAADAGPLPEGDDTLTLLFLCCHPELSPASQLALDACARSAV